MSITILVFGQLTEITGAQQFVVNDVADTDALVIQLNKHYPALAGSKYMMAVNKELVTANTALRDNATVAFLPPFSGG